MLKLPSKIAERRLILYI